MGQSGPVFRKILTVRIDATTYEDACNRIQCWAEQRISGYVVAANVHVVMTAYWHQAYQEVLRRALLVTSDGMPIVFGMRMLGVSHQSRVYGPDLMLAWCERAAQLQMPIYLYGCTENQLVKAVQTLRQRFPELPIAGYHAPPFRPLTPEEEKADCDRIIRSGARVVFVSLGCPKQEYWMARQQGRLPMVMMGVGAAISFLSGEINQAPRWMMRCSLEWLYRFTQEPRRLWQRYLINNPAFLLLFGLQLLGYWARGIKKAID